jgi:methylmalonyl-CoA mutase N-terminal domain/subunit
LERLTLDMEKGAFDYFDKLDAMGGMVKAIEKGYPQKEIAEASYQFQRAAEARRRSSSGPMNSPSRSSLRTFSISARRSPNTRRKN